MGAWDRAFADGCAGLVYIPMSSGLSGSCQTAAALAEDYGGRVQVVDNHRISVTQRHSVQDALTLEDRAVGRKRSGRYWSVRLMSPSSMWG